MTRPLPPGIPTAGVYAIRNRENGKVFVGSGRNVDKLVRDFLIGLQRGRISMTGSDMVDDFRVYGPAAFEGLILQRTADVGELQPLRAEWIQRLDAIRQGYNMREPSLRTFNTEQRLAALERGLAEVLELLQGLKEKP